MEAGGKAGVVAALIAAAVGAKEIAVVPKVAEVIAPTVRETGSVFAGAHNASGIRSKASEFKPGSADYNSSFGDHYRQQYTPYDGLHTRSAFGDADGGDFISGTSNNSSVPTRLSLQAGIANPGPIYTVTKAKHELSKQIDAAIPTIATDLSLRNGNFTVTYAQRVIEENLVAAASKKADPLITFEAMTGKIKVDASVRMGRAQVAVGEVNVYKLSAAAAVGVTACKGLGAQKFDECVKKALDKAFGEEFVLNSPKSSG